MVGRRKVSFFNEIKLRVLNKLSTWHSKLFSSKGKEVLVNAVAQAILTYAMSVFKLLSSIYEDIQKAIARFGGDKKMDRRGSHWTKWDKLYHTKMRGGLGFRDFLSFNQVLIAKQRRRIIQHTKSLMSRVLKTRYFK